MNNSYLLKYSFEGLKFLAPILSKFLNENSINKRLKRVRLHQNRITIILLSKKGGKTYITDYLRSLDVNNNSLYIDLDDSILLSSDYNYSNMLKSLNNDNDILYLLPHKLEVLRKLKHDFQNKNIIIFTSDFELAKYLNENERCELNTYCMTYNLYNITSSLTNNEDEKKLLLKSYIQISKIRDVKNYSSFEELREMIKILLI